MYDKMKGTKFERYVANPQRGSMHNYSIAVDITIVDEQGNELHMGISPFKKNTIQIVPGWLLISSMQMERNLPDLYLKSLRPNQEQKVGIK